MAWGGASYGETARPWEDILAFYEGLARNNPAFEHLAQLAGRIARSPFPAAGLSALTSMHELLVAPSTSILDGPHLRISCDFDRQLITLTYEEGSGKPKPWKRQVSPEQAYEALERFLVKRARWFRDHRAAKL
jgi:hypothetical protein